MDELDTLRDLVENGYTIYRGMVSIRKSNDQRTNLKYIVTTTGAMSKERFDNFDDALSHVQLFQEDAFNQKYTVHEIEDKKFIHGHCKVTGDDLIHVPKDHSNEMTLCGQPVILVARGLLNATCEKCREIWHDQNPVELK